MPNKERPLFRWIRTVRCTEKLDGTPGIQVLDGLLQSPGVEQILDFEHNETGSKATDAESEGVE